MCVKCALSILMLVRLYSDQNFVVLKVSEQTKNKYRLILEVNGFFFFLMYIFSCGCIHVHIIHILT